jgi:molybdopterin-guanine dinucleotide biosynthesis protein MobB
MLTHARVPVIGFVAWRSNTGKTTLLTRLLPLLVAQGIRVGMIKHAHHEFDIDIPGKDSYELRKAGAQQMLVASAKRWALMVETPQAAHDPELDRMLAQLDQSTLDLILVEGFRHVAYPKIELHRAELDSPHLFPDDPDIIAVASDAPVATSLPRLDINRPQDVAEFILARLKQ